MRNARATRERRRTRVRARVHPRGGSRRACVCVSVWRVYKRAF